ncbi:MAG: hypothetical protein ABSG53_25695, partial [Thermoguttaceae bacterium]
MTYYYTAFPAVGTAPLESSWESLLWQRAEDAQIDQFHAASTSHRPVAQARLLYDAANLYLRFRVEDCYVVA